MNKIEHLDARCAVRVERQQKIVELVMQNSKVSVADICELFDVSEMTARRDLQDLSREGLVRRVHGGAVSSLGRSYEPPYQLRSSKNLSAKEAIGHTAAEMIYDGDSIALDVGTTTLEIARALHGKHNLTVVTSSLPIANEIVSNFSLDKDIRLILTGGIVRSSEFSMVGDFAARVYSELHVDKAFLGIGGIDIEDGLSEYNLEDAMVKWSLLRNAHQVIVVADSSKFRRTTFASVGALSEIDTIVTDANIDKAMIDSLEDIGVKVVIAGQ